MRAKRAGSRALILSALALASIALGGASAASADVGVERVSRSAGSPGDEVVLALGCGFCFPPCEGPKGERHPKGFERGPCMLGTEADPPQSFGISLVPVAKAPRPHRCGPRRTCPPQAKAPPRRAPFTYLGNAVPPPGGNDPADGIPRYLLRFEVPDLRPGRYAFVIYCDVCLAGEGGSLISYPSPPEWRFRLLP